MNGLSLKRKCGYNNYFCYLERIEFVSGFKTMSVLAAPGAAVAEHGSCEGSRDVLTEENKGEAVSTGCAHIRNLIFLLYRGQICREHCV